MAGEPSGWYADPTTRHVYRYWNGFEWTDQVTDGGTSGMDPIALEPQVATTPPGPGTRAPGQVEPPPRERAPTKNSNWVMLVVVLVAILVLAMIAVAITNDDSDGGDPETPTTAETTPPDTETTETPDRTETTETPDTTEAAVDE